MDTKAYLISAKVNMEKALSEVFDVLGNLTQDSQNLKLKAFQPTPIEAKVFLDYFSWEDGSAKQNFKAFYSKELQILEEWLEIFCLLNNCTREEALSRVTDGVL